MHTEEHLKYGSYKVCPLFSMCFAGCLVRGVLPNSFMSAMLVPVLKDEAGKLNSMESYRPIALASIFSKVGLLARIQKTRLEMYDLTSDSQFGFKKKKKT